MTWNVENLFPPGSAFGPDTQAIYDEKLDGLAAVINAEAPHALGLQEIGDPDALDDLEPRLQGTHLASAGIPARGRPRHPGRVADTA